MLSKKHITTFLFSKVNMYAQGYSSMRRFGISRINAIWSISFFAAINFVFIRIGFYKVLIYTSRDKRNLYRLVKKISFFSQEWLNDCQFIILLQVLLSFYFSSVRTIGLTDISYIAFFFDLFGRISNWLASSENGALLESIVGRIDKKELLIRFSKALQNSIEGVYEHDLYLDELGLDNLLYVFGKYFVKSTSHIKEIYPESYKKVLENIKESINLSLNADLFVASNGLGEEINIDTLEKNIESMKGQNNAEAIIWTVLLGKVGSSRFREILKTSKRAKSLNNIINNFSEVIYIITSYKYYLENFEHGNFYSWVTSYTKSKGEIDEGRIKEYVNNIKYPEALNNLVKDINEFELKEEFIELVIERMQKIHASLVFSKGKPRDILTLLFLRILLMKRTNRSPLNLATGSALRNAPKYMDFLYDITRLFSSIDSFEEICQKVVNALESEFTFNGAVIFLFHEGNKSIYPFTASQTALIQRTLTMLPVSLKDMKISMTEDDNLVVKSCLDKRPYVHKDYWRFAPKVAVPVAPYIQRFAGINIAVSYPILYKDEVLGALLVSTTKESFGRDDMYVLDVFSTIAGNAIKNWYLTHELSEKIKSLEESNKFKSELLEIASHELRTPITIIRDSLSMIDDDGQSEYLYYAKMASARQLILINNILNSSMIENSSFILYKNEIDINELVKRIVNELSIFTHEKELEIEMELGESCILNADPQKLSQVLYNLIYNSLKYTKKGVITVSTEKINNHIHVVVKDTGDGIPKKEIPALFNKYERGTSEAIKGTFGSGIGLYISKYIIEAHNGSIKVQSHIKRGSTFEFTIPC